MIKIEEATTHHAVDIARLTGALLSEIMDVTNSKAFEYDEEETIERINAELRGFENRRFFCVLCKKVRVLEIPLERFVIFFTH